MGDFHQDLVFKNVSDSKIDEETENVIGYLIKAKIISTKKADNILKSEFGYCPGEAWYKAVEDSTDPHFLSTLTNGLEVRKGRTIFWADGREFEKIECPNCGENNLNCDWGELFNLWLKYSKSADLECSMCKKVSSISEYIFEPKWALSNLGFVFWNWPLLKKSFVIKLEKIMGYKIQIVEGKI